MNKSIIMFFIFMCLAQVGAWVQQYFHAKYEWINTNWVLWSIVTSIPLGLLFVYSSKLGVTYFGATWPVRIIQISIGFLVASVMAYSVLGEGLTNKTIISIALCGVILYLQFK